MKLLRQAPAVPSVDELRTPSGTVPPWSATSSTARAAHASTGWSADSKPRSSTEEPSVTPADVASPPSRTRQLVGNSPLWLTARQASAAASRVAKRAEADALN